MVSQALPLENSNPLVLVVDDEVSICDTLSQVLEDEAFSTITAHNGADAIERVKEFQPAVVFLDMWMPGWDGIETLERIKEIAPDTEVVMISGHATISSALEAQKLGAFDFIEKPLDIESVIVSASRALKRRSQASDTGPEAILSGLLPHPGVGTKGLAGDNLGQRTLKKSAILYGQGLHSGQKSGLVLEPLPYGSGIHFAKIGKSKSVPAFVDHVDSTAFATRVQLGDIGVATIEHLLSALHAYRLTNVLVKCNEEVPIFDGSALEFCQAIEEVGIEEQGGEWFEVAVTEACEVQSEGGQLLRIEPAEDFSIHYELHYPEPVGRQVYDFTMRSPKSFVDEIAPARTFGFMKDIEMLQKRGLAAGGRLDNFILIGDDSIVNTKLRFEDELVRHKILDIMGDLFLLGRPLKGRITARMTGHSDNISLLRELKSAIN